MKRLLILAVVLCGVLAVAYAGITLYDARLPFGRMWETPAVKPHEAPLPVMPKGSVPVFGGEALLRSKGPEHLEDPVSDRSLKRIFAGKRVYGRYCIHCHGKRLDGRGTVGQSFSPLPRDLKSPHVRDLKDGTLFYRISYGKARMPALAATVSVAERWDVIVYLRAVAAGKVMAGP